MYTVPKSVAVRAGQSGGIVMREDLGLQGYGEWEIRRLSASLVQVRRGAYCLEPPTTPEAMHVLMARAALKSHCDSQFLSHASAALAWGLPLFRVDLARVHLSRDRGQRAKTTPGIRYHNYPVIPEDQTHQLPNVRVTAATRTVIDCAVTLPTDSAVVIVDAALHRGMTSLSHLSERVSAMTRRKGLSAARRVLALADIKAESPGESRLRLLLGDLGIHVVSQAVINDGARTLARADFRIRDSRVLIEFDGRAKYKDDPERYHWEEKQRHDLLVAAGYEVVRVVWAQLEDPQAVKRAIDQALTRSRR
ncbi:MAG: hypothetical protein U0904_06745 [Candidatus Nanopelagicales bacterium]|nr:hypothetical protein [Candidatus Nanopelagicales bacterium]